MINAQSLMIAYLDDYKLMLYITLAAIPLLLLLRHKPAGAQPVSAAAAMAD